MSASTLERRPITTLPSHPVSDGTNLLVKEANWNRDMFGEDYKTELIRKLTHQSPNRIYASLDGRICRALLFSDHSQPYQMYLEIMQGEKLLDRVKSQFFSGVNSASIELEINQWRRSFGMSLDLLESPTAVLEVESEYPVPQRFLSIVTKGQRPLAGAYFIGALGQPRMEEISYNFDLAKIDGTLTPSSVPEEIKTWAHPFKQ